MGSDFHTPIKGEEATIFQSTLPVWGATLASLNRRSEQQFQSTLPVWGATRCKLARLVRRADFNPRSPCGERRRRSALGPTATDFNPRSPCGERPPLPCYTFRAKKFQSTLPVWGATATFCSFVPSIASLLCSQSPIGQFHQQNSAAYPETTRNSVRTHRVASVCHLLALTAPGSLQGRSPALHRSVLLCHASYSRGGKCGRCLFPCS